MLLPPALLLGASIAEAVGGWLVLCADRGEPVRVTARDVTRSVREGSARALFRAMAPFAWGEPSLGPSGPGTPVLCVADPRLGRQETLFLETWLKNRGFPLVTAADLRHGPERGLNDLAEDLAVAVRQLSRLGGGAPIDIVGHGLGGLVAAYAVHHFVDLPVRRLVTIATPWKGTKTAVFGRDRLAREARFESERLVGLAPRVPTWALWSPADPFVVPSTSAIPAGAEAVRLDDLGHTELLVSAIAYRAIEAVLRDVDATGARPEPAPDFAPDPEGHEPISDFGLDEPGSSPDPVPPVAAGDARLPPAADGVVPPEVAVAPVPPAPVAGAEVADARAPAAPVGGPATTENGRETGTPGASGPATGTAGAAGTPGATTPTSVATEGTAEMGEIPADVPAAGTDASGDSPAAPEVSAPAAPPPEPEVFAEAPPSVHAAGNLGEIPVHPPDAPTSGPTDAPTPDPGTDAATPAPRSRRRLLDKPDEDR